MVGLNATNLGDQAQTIRLIAREVSAESYQQPFVASGSLAVPVGYSTNATTTYQAGISKYILYMTADVTTNPIATTFSVAGFPLGFASTHTFSGTASIIISGLTPTITTNTPIYTTNLKVLNDTNGLTTAELNMFSSTSPAYTPPLGAVLKIVISINLD